MCMYCPYNSNIMVSAGRFVNKQGASTYFGLKRSQAAVLNQMNVLKKYFDIDFSISFRMQDYYLHFDP